MNPIIPIYAQLIKDGDKTIEQVPARIRDEVQTYLNAGEQNA
ncbi:MAG: CD1375 family protein [Solibacillus sp.]